MGVKLSKCNKVPLIRLRTRIIRFLNAPRKEIGKFNVQQVTNNRLCHDSLTCQCEEYRTFSKASLGI